MILFFFIYILAFLPLHSDVEDYFKPVLNKSDLSKIRNIDFIYLINLDERPEKLMPVLEMLAPFEITPCRFSAINGWNLPLNVITDVGVQYESWMSNDRWGTFYFPEGDRIAEHEIVSAIGRTYFCHCLSFGAIGCVLSHLSILQDALDSGYETIWIMEDDIEIIQNPHLLSDRIEELDLTVGKEGWDILFTDRDTKNTEGYYVPCHSYAWKPNYTPSNTQRFAERRDISAHLMQVGARYGSYSMILRRSGIKKILNFIKCFHIFLPYDMDYTQPANIRLFCVTEDIVSTQPRALSDNGSPLYLQNQRQDLTN
jgi:GR25 family glycosyltransferase involved in LPS biosynthesis